MKGEFYMDFEVENMNKIREFLYDVFISIIDSKFVFLFFIAFLLLLGFGLVYLKYLLFLLTV